MNQLQTLLTFVFITSYFILLKFNYKIKKIITKIKTKILINFSSFHFASLLFGQ